MDIYVPVLERAWTKAMTVLNLPYALESIKDLIMQLMRVWQTVMLFEEATYCDDWSIKTTKVESAKYLLKCLRYMKLEENEKKQFTYL